MRITTDMSRRLPLLAALLLLAAGCGDDAAPRPAPGRLVAEPLEIDLGALDWGATATREIRLHNAGPIALQIGAITTGCGCVEILERPRRVAAGGRAAIRLGFRMRLEAGAWRSSLRIENDGESGALRVALRARIRPAWRLVGSDADLSILDGGRPTSGVLRLESTIGTQPRIARVRTSGADLQVDAPIARPPAGLEIPYRLTPPEAPGHHRREITLFCVPGDPHGRLTPALEFWVRGSLDAEPRRLSFPADAAGERRLELRGRAGEPLRFLSGSGRGAAVEILHVDEAGDRLGLTLRARAPENPAQLLLRVEQGGRPVSLAVGLRGRDELPR